MTALHFRTRSGDRILLLWEETGSLYPITPPPLLLLHLPRRSHRAGDKHRDVQRDFRPARNARRKRRRADEEPRHARAGPRAGSVCLVAMRVRHVYVGRP